MKSQVFKQLMQAISYGKFQSIVNTYGGDRYSKNFSSWNHLQLMIYFQLAGWTSIRDVINSLKSKTKDLYHSGLVVPSRNNLSHQNFKRDYRTFQETFYSLKVELCGKSALSVRRKFKFNMPVKFFASSTISLCNSLFGWAKFRRSKSGIKLHTLLNNETQVLNSPKITDAKLHDIKGLWKTPIERNTIYVLDRACLCFKWLYSVVLGYIHFGSGNKIYGKEKRRLSDITKTHFVQTF